MPYEPLNQFLLILVQKVNMHGVKKSILFIVFFLLTLSASLGAMFLPWQNQSEDTFLTPNLSTEVLISSSSEPVAPLSVSETDKETEIPSPQTNSPALVRSGMYTEIEGKFENLNASEKRIVIEALPRYSDVEIRNGHIPYWYNDLSLNRIKNIDEARTDRYPKSCTPSST